MRCGSTTAAWELESECSIKESLSRVDAYEATAAVHNANADASDIEDRGQEIQIEIGVTRFQAG